MKSKSYTLKNSSVEKGQLNQTFDFVTFYKSAAETNAKLSGKRKSGDNLNKENDDTVPVLKLERPKHKKFDRQKKSRNDPIDTSVVNIGGQCESPAAAVRCSSLGAPALPVKSIMKHPAHAPGSQPASATKPKKRNKSVTFLLEDNDGVVMKKVRSEESMRDVKHKKKPKQIVVEKKHFKKLKKHVRDENNTKFNVFMPTENNDENVPGERKQDKSLDVPVSECLANDKKKKLRRLKKRRKGEDGSPNENESNNNEELLEQKMKKLKKKKHMGCCPDTTETDGEPATKSSKKEVIPDVIAESLQNLSIGDNAHSLSSLLDEMTVVDKDKKKKNKMKRRKNKSQKPASLSSSEAGELEKIEEGKEKVKWKKRKWNKEKKPDGEPNDLMTSIIVEDLPVKIIGSYKNFLTHHFGREDLVKKIGPAEVYPSEKIQLVFTTTITFYNEAAAIKALQKDKSYIEGCPIHVRRPPPPCETTVVVRSYGELCDQSLSSIFSTAGRIRNIKHLVKGKKAMGTAFVEFDGPEAVQNAIKIAEDAKIGGKKVHISKFEQRSAGGKKTPRKKDSDDDGGSDSSGDD